jgi:hypothetical protein
MKSLWQIMMFLLRGEWGHGEWGLENGDWRMGTDGTYPTF